MTTQANTYRVIGAPSGFSNPDFNMTAFYTINNTDVGSLHKFSRDLADDFRARIQTSGLFTNLDAGKCIEAYNQQYVAAWGDLVLEYHLPIYRAVEQLSKNPSCDFNTYSNHSCTERTATEYLPICGGSMWDVESQSWQSFYSTMNSPSTSWQLYQGSFNASSSGQKYLWQNMTGFFSNSTMLGYQMEPAFSATSVPASYPSYEWQWQSETSNYDEDVLPHVPDTAWRPFGAKIEQCWAERVSERCTLNFHLYFALIVIVANITKVVAMSLTFWRHKKSALMTIGDAVASFLNKPDESTRGVCLFSASMMHLRWEWRTDGFKTSLQREMTQKTRLDNLKPTSYKPERWRWGHSASVMRWVSCFTL